MRVAVEKKETGETGLKLEPIADDQPVKPKKEDPEGPKPKKKTARKATTRKAATAKQAPKGGKGGENAKQRTIVPQLPRRG